jgi:hypothetical protein
VPCGWHGRQLREVTVRSMRHSPVVEYIGQRGAEDPRQERGRYGPPAPACWSACRGETASRVRNVAAHRRRPRQVGASGRARARAALGILTFTPASPAQLQGALGRLAMESAGAGW